VALKEDLESAVKKIFHGAQGKPSAAAVVSVSCIGPFDKLRARSSGVLDEAEDSASSN
jgi:hypothetical protein